jgi:uncharacterized protein (DUF885 family)
MLPIADPPTPNPTAMTTLRWIPMMLILILTACAAAAVDPEPAPTPMPSPAPTPPAAPTPRPVALESERLASWLDEVFQAELARSPQAQTQLGLIDDLEAYGRWDDPSDAAAVARHARLQQYLAELREWFDVEALDEGGRTSYRFAAYEWELADRLHRVRESGYVFSPMLDAVSGMTSFLINNHRVAERVHADAYVSRLQGTGAVIDELVAEAERRAGVGVRLPLFAYPRLIESARRLIAGAPFEPGEEDGPLLADFRSKVAALGLPTAEERELVAAAEAALRDSYQPAIERYIASLQRMEAGADSLAGAWKLPRGEEFYAAQLELFTTRDDLTAADIHAIGLAEVARIQGEMREIMRQVGFDGTLQEFFAFLRTDPRFYYPDTPEGRRRYLDESTRLIEQVMEVAPRYFDRLPRAPLEVRAVEPFREATATGAFYNPPSLDGSRPGYYYVNLADMRDNPTYLMEALAYHEGAPGHHFQIALAQELEDLPMMQRLAWFSAYGEGWALYAERLGKDMGFYTDPYNDFGRLGYEIFRAARLVVDTGLHDQQWTREQAIDYMLENTPFTQGDITPEVERYIVWPGQAVSYKIGMMTILELRERARAELGDRFAWGGFHDAVLTAGTLPLPILTERVEAWIDAAR